MNLHPLRSGALAACLLPCLASAAAPHGAEMAERGRAGTLTVSITNLTSHTWLAPVLVAAHPPAFQAYREGQPASSQLQALAEIGDIGPLAAGLPAGSSTALNPAQGPLKPGASVSTAVLSGGKGSANTRLSVLAMLVPTNDGFIGLNAIEIPKRPGTYVYLLSAHDAGTEANDEAMQTVAGVGQRGMGLPPFLNDARGRLSADINPHAAGFAHAAREGFVHIHRGIVGSAAGGPSALDQANYRWLNPVARVSVTVR